MIEVLITTFLVAILLATLISLVFLVLLPLYLIKAIENESKKKHLKREKARDRKNKRGGRSLLG